MQIKVDSKQCARRTPKQSAADQVSRCDQSHLMKRLLLNVFHITIIITIIIIIAYNNSPPEKDEPEMLSLN